jgi:VWFA-related protein
MALRYSRALLAVVVLAGVAESQTPASPDLFSTKVDWVVLNASVRDRKGLIVSDLSEPDFQIYEDKIHQSIKLFRREDIAVTVGLVVDHSASMHPKLPDVILAARTFAESSRLDDSMFVINFNERVTVELPGANQHSDRPDQLALAIESRPTQGKTALYDAVIEALGQLQFGRPEKKVLIVISDGGDNASTHDLAQVLSLLERANAVVYTIGLFTDEDPDKNPAVLRRLAHITGGEAFFPRQTGEVLSICSRIARDIRNQYTIGYASSNVEQPGAYRAIRLVAQAAGKGKLVVRTRAGYIAGETAK